MDAAEAHRRRRRAPASSRSSSSTAASCRARWSRSSIAASRRRCRSSRASTAARSARCASLAPPVPADAATYEKEIRAALRRPRRRLPQALSGERPAGEHARDHARRAVRLDRRAAGDASRPRSACRPSSICSITAIRRPMRGPARLPCQRDALRLRHGRQDAAELAQGAGDAGRDASSPMRCSTTGLSFARTGVPSAAGQPQWPAYGSRARLHGVRRRAAAEDASVARHVRAQRTGRVPAPRRRAAFRGTGTSASHRRRCPPQAAHADDRRRDAAVSR